MHFKVHAKKVTENMGYFFNVFVKSNLNYLKKFNFIYYKEYDKTYN